MIQGQNVNREGAVAQLSGDEVQNFVIRSGAESAVRSGFTRKMPLLAIISASGRV